MSDQTIILHKVFVIWYSRRKTLVLRYGVSLCFGTPRDCSFKNSKRNPKWKSQQVLHINKAQSHGQVPAFQNATWDEALLNYIRQQMLLSAIRYSFVQKIYMLGRIKWIHKWSFHIYLQERIEVVIHSTTRTTVRIVLQLVLPQMPKYFHRIKSSCWFSLFYRLKKALTLVSKASSLFSD